MTYKQVCLSCRKAFSANAKDISVSGKKCPQCGKLTNTVDHKFRPPRKTDAKKWEVVGYLIDNGFRYDHVYEMIEPGVYLQGGSYPVTMKEAEEFVKKYKPSADP